MPGFWDYSDGFDAHTNAPLSNPPTSTPTPAAPSGPLPPGAPLGATLLPGGGWVTYGPNGQVTGGGGPGNGSGGAAGAPGAPGAAGGSPTDRNYVRQQISNLMQQHGVTPGGRGSGVADLEYYTDKAMETGGWTKDNAGYWTGRWQSDAGGGSQGGSQGAGGTLGGAMGGDLLQPYDKQFSAPVGTDDPGFQFAVQQGQQGIERSAAAKGTLLTGGTLKDLAQFTTGAALQDYAGAYNRALSTFGTNYDIFRNNQNDAYSKLYGVTNLGLNAAQGYAGNLGSNLGAGLNAGSHYNDNVSNATIAGGNIAGQSAINHGNTLSNYAAIGTNLGNSLLTPRNRPFYQPNANSSLQGG